MSALAIYAITVTGLAVLAFLTAWCAMDQSKQLVRERDVARQNAAFARLDADYWHRQALHAETPCGTPIFAETWTETSGGDAA